MVMGNERTLAARLTLKDQLTPQLKKASQGIMSFRTELRRASIQLGIMTGSGAVALRSWGKAAEENRNSLQLIASSLKTAGDSAVITAPKLEGIFTALSEKSGVKIGDIRDIWVDIFQTLGNADLAAQLTPLALALNAITGTNEGADLLAKALAGDEGAVEQLRKLSGVDLTGINTEGERLKKLLDSGLADRMNEAKDPTDKFTNAMEGLKTALGDASGKAMAPTLDALADAMIKITGNKEATAFAGTFVAWATGLGLIATALASLSWLAASHPVVLGLIAIVALGASLPAALAALDAFAESKRQGLENLKTAVKDFMHDPDVMKYFGIVEGSLIPVPPTSITGDPDANNLQTYERALGDLFKNLEGAQDWGGRGGRMDRFISWFSSLDPDVQDFFLPKLRSDPRLSDYWQFLPPLAVDPNLGGGGYTPNPGMAAASFSGGGSTNITIVSNGDLDWERRLREIAERQAQIGAR